ncbi:MAG: RluA family pseudouridine synthase [Elusimicrobiota bacterium]
MKLLQAVREKYPQLSRKKARALLRAGKIRLNKRRAKISDRVRAADTVSIPREHLADHLTANSALKISVLKETAEFLFLRKPSGVHSVAQDFADTNSVANWLLSHDPGCAALHPLECGLAHRLDYETSGVMVAAKTKTALAFLRRAFKERRVEKIYTCLVSGEPLARGVYRASARPGAKSAKKVRLSPQAAGGPELITEVRSCRRAGKYYRLTLQLITGYRHQLRAQLALLERPIAGDPLYGGAPAPRLMLHARSLAFQHAGRACSAASPARFPVR